MCGNDHTLGHYDDDKQHNTTSIKAEDDPNGSVQSKRDQRDTGSCGDSGCEHRIKLNSNSEGSGSNYDEPTSDNQSTTTSRKKNDTDDENNSNNAHQTEDKDCLDEDDANIPNLLDYVPSEPLYNKANSIDSKRFGSSSGPRGRNKYLTK